MIINNQIIRVILLKGKIMLEKVTELLADRIAKHSQDYKNGYMSSVDFMLAIEPYIQEYELIVKSVQEYTYSQRVKERKVESCT